MQFLFRLLAMGTLAGSTVLCAQNFNGSDDFSSPVAGNWSVDTSAGTVPGAAFTLGGGVLNFTAPAMNLTHDDSRVWRDWTLNAGSYTADWQVQADFTINPVSSSFGRGTSLILSIANNSDTGDYSQLDFQLSSGARVFGRIVANNNYLTPLASANVGATATTVTMRASYLAATHELNLAVNQGAGFTTLSSANLTSWDMTASDTFAVRLFGGNVAIQSDPTSAVGSGEVYIDNFVATGAAIPEPSAYAAGFGLIGLLAAGLKRRFGQK